MCAGFCTLTASTGAEYRMQLSAVVSAEGHPCQHLPLPAVLCVWEGLGAVHQTRVFQVSVQRLDAAGFAAWGSGSTRDREP